MPYSDYQAIGEPHVGFVACQRCFAVVVHGDVPHHDEWHEKLNHWIDPVCSTCNGQGWTVEHAPSCDGNCERHGCPIQAQCRSCDGVDQRPPVTVPAEWEEPF